MTVIKQFNPGTLAWDPILVGEIGPAGPPGPAGPAGPQGAPGVGEGGTGVPGGGDIGTVLAKSSTANGAVAWRPQRYVDITDYGAIADNSTDCTAAIQAADNVAALTGQVVWFPVGQFRVLGTINKNPSTQWRGIGNNPYVTSIKGSNIRYAGEGICVSVNPTTHVDNCRGRIGGIRFNYVGSNGAATTSTAILINNVSDQVIEECYVLTFHIGVDIGTSSSATYLVRCWIGSGNIGVRSTGASDNWLIETQAAGRQYGVWGIQSSSMQFVDSRIQGSGNANAFLDRCQYFKMTGGLSDSATLSSSGTREGLRLKDCPNCTVTGVTFYSNVAHLIIENTGTDYNGTFGMSIVGCVFNGNDSITIEQNGGVAKNVTIANNSNGSAIATMLVVKAPTGGATPIQGLTITGNSGGGLGMYGLQHADQATLKIAANTSQPSFESGVATVNGGTFVAPFYAITGPASARVGLASAQAPSITGDLCVVVEVAADDWTPAAGVRQTIISHYTSAGGNNRSWSLDIRPSGTAPTNPHSLSFVWSVTGSSTVITKNLEGTLPGAVDGAKLFLAVTHDVDNGAGGNDVRIWSSPDGTTWTQFGTTQTTTGVTSHAAVTAEITMSGIVGATSQAFPGKFYSASIRNGIGAGGTVGGTEVAQWSAASLPMTAYQDAYGGIWGLRAPAKWGGTGSGGLPAGGATGTALVKASGSDLAAVWQSKAVFDVRDYGAVGNGSTDATTQIQAALDACQAAGGGEVTVPAGTWVLSAPLIVPNGVSLWGVGGGWAILNGSTRPMTLFKCTTTTAKIAVDGSGGTIGNFSIDGMDLADGPLLHRRNVAAKRLFQSIFLARAKVEAWRIDFAQNDVWVDISTYWQGGTGLVMDKGAGGHAFYGCEFGGCTNWHLIITETDGTGPYSSPSHNTFDHCLFEMGNQLGANTVTGCIWIKTGKRTVFRDCACNPVVAPSDGCIKIDGSGMGADPIVIMDGCWWASAVAGATGVIQDAGAVLIYGNTEFNGFLNAWRFNGGTASVDGSITYTGVTNRWDPAGTGEFRNIVASHSRPINIRTESNDFYGFRTAVLGDTGSRLDITTTGGLAFGSGTGATDATITRASANRLHMSGAWRVAGALEAAAALAHQGTTVGFYNVTPIVRGTVPAAATDPTTTMALVNSLRTALINLGLVQ